MKEPDTSETTAMVNDHLSQDTFKQQQQQLFSELPSSCPPGAPSPYTLPTSYHDSSAYDYRSSPSLSRPETLGKFHPYDMGHYGVLPSTMLPPPPPPSPPPLPHRIMELPVSSFGPPTSMPPPLPIYDTKLASMSHIDKWFDPNRLESMHVGYSVRPPTRFLAAEEIERDHLHYISYPNSQADRHHTHK
jgi:hypothetical protein